MHSEDFQALFESAKRGDAQAKELLFRHLRARIYHVAKKRVREEHLEDLVQETIVTVLKQFDRLHHPEEVLPFCYMVLRHKIGNYIQRERRSRVTEVPPAPAAHDPNDPHAQLASRELEEGLRREIAIIGQQRPDLAQLADWLRQGWTAAEIAEALGKSTQAVHNMTFQLRKKLKKALGLEHGSDT